jgi:ribosomal protein S12 methylthiotransferase
MASLRLNSGISGETQEDFNILKTGFKKWNLTEWVVCLLTWRNTHAYLLEDDVPADVKQDRANEIMELQSQISWDLNQLKLGKTFKCIIDRKKAAICRKNWFDVDVDNEVLIDQNII